MRNLFTLVLCATIAPAPAVKHAYPAFSPDGQWIAFSADDAGNHDLFLVRADGSGRRLLAGGEHNETQPSWSPDGRRIVYVRASWNPSTRSSLYIVDVAGGTPERIAGVDDAHLPHWAADGRIYFSLRVNGRDDIVSIRPDGSDRVNHTNTPDVDETNVAVHGRTLAYDRQAGQDGADYVIELLDLDTGKKRVLREPATDWDPAWMPDGRSLLVGAYATRNAAMSMLVQVDLQGRISRRLSPEGRNVFWPSVSSDSKYVVFSYSDEDFGVGELCLLDLATGEMRPLLPRAGTSPEGRCAGAR